MHFDFFKNLFKSILCYVVAMLYIIGSYYAVSWAWEKEHVLAYTIAAVLFWLGTNIKINETNQELQQSYDALKFLVAAFFVLMTIVYFIVKLIVIGI